MVSTIQSQGSPAQIPLLPPPNGQISNFDDPESLAIPALVIGIVFTIASGVLVVLRLTLVFSTKGRLALEDYLCLSAQILNIAYFSVVSSVRDTFRHPWDIPMTAFTPAVAKSGYVMSALSGPCLWLCKAAILVLYLRLFGMVPWLRVTAKVVLCLSFLVYLSSLPVASAFCTPKPGRDWDLQLLASCGKVKWQGLLQGSLNVAINSIILILPLPVIKNLKLRPRKKVALSIVFLMGSFAFVAASITLYFGASVYDSSDYTWDAPKIYIYMYVESYVTVMVSCAPAVHALWTSQFSKKRNTTRRNASPAPFPKQPLISRPDSTANLIRRDPQYYELHETSTPPNLASGIVKTTEIRQTAEVVPYEIHLEPDDPYGGLFK